MAKKSTKKSKTIKSTPIILKKHEELVKELYFVAEWVEVNTDELTVIELQELVDIATKRNANKIISVIINAEGYAVVTTCNAGDYIYKHPINIDYPEREYTDEVKEDFNEDNNKNNFTRM